MNYNLYSAYTPAQTAGVTLPEVGAGGSISTTANGVTVTAQITGVIVILLVIAIVFMVHKWPILS
jgi:hypothetical protein